MKRGAFCHKFSFAPPGPPPQGGGRNILFSPGAHPHLATALFLITCKSILIFPPINITRPAWAGFKTAEEARAKHMLIFMVKVKEKK